MQNIKFEEKNVSKDASIHILPCKIMHDGDAQVKSYFQNSILPSKLNIKDDESTKVESNVLFYVQWTVRF
jgi:hypothetical protein